MVESKIQGAFIDLGNESSIVFFSQFFVPTQAWQWIKSLDQEIPWCRPSLHVFGRACTQPRETCYVADTGLPPLKYSGFEPVVHSWDDCASLKSILNAVHEALPGTSFNSVLLNRYAGGKDYAGWHADDEKLYGHSPTIASVSLGAERDFLIRKKKNKQVWQKMGNVPYLAKRKSIEEGWPVSHHDINRFKSSNSEIQKQKQNIQVSEENRVTTKRDTYSFPLKHGSLLLMMGNMQKDWEHSVPRRMKLQGLRINLTFRQVLDG